MRNKNIIKNLVIDARSLRKDVAITNAMLRSSQKSFLAEVKELEARIAELELKAEEEHRMVEARFRYYLNQATLVDRISDEERLLTDILKCIEVEMEDVQEGSSDARIYEGLDIAWAIVQFHLDNLAPF